MNNSDLEKIESLNDQSKALFDIDHWGRETINLCAPRTELGCIDLDHEPTVKYFGEYVPFTLE
jgi:hypothetical protein